MVQSVDGVGNQKRAGVTPGLLNAPAYEKTINICVLGVSVASLEQDAWVLIPSLSLNHFMIQDNSFNHSVPQFPPPWLYLTYLLNGEVVKFKGAVIMHVNALGESAV